MITKTRITPYPADEEDIEDKDSFAGVELDVSEEVVLKVRVPQYALDCVTAGITLAVFVYVPCVAMLNKCCPKLDRPKSKSY